jgi:hypothetical protein
MRPILLLVLIATLGAGARAEVFAPRVVSGRGDHVQRPAHFDGRVGYRVGDRGHGQRFGGYGGWRGHNDFWSFRAGWWGPRAVWSLGFNDGFYDGWYGWPRWEPRYAWYDRPAVYYPPIRSAYYAPYQSVASYSVVSRPVSTQVHDDIRDARSPEQLRAIYGAQAEGLIRSE